MYSCCVNGVDNGHLRAGSCQAGRSKAVPTTRLAPRGSEIGDLHTILAIFLTPAEHVAPRMWRSIAALLCTSCDPDLSIFPHRIVVVWTELPTVDDNTGHIEFPRVKIAITPALRLFSTWPR
jgi:hypothetical protein